MKVLHVISGLARQSGGPSRSSQGLVATECVEGVDASIWTLDGATPWVHGVQVAKISFGMKGWRNELCIYDIVHIHGIWDLRIHKIVAECRRKKIPYIISPRGMLDPWALSVKWWKKRIAMFLYQRGDLECAAAFHVTAELEAESVRAQGLNQPLIIAPNGVDVPMRMPPRTNGGKKRTAIFLSRLHPGKGLLALADAWARLKPNGWVMKVVGPDSYGHKVDVLAKLEELGIQDQWQFVDMLDDEEKWVAYRGADLLIHPSVSENFGITIAEGLAAGLPVIATKGTPWQDLETFHCGWWIDLPSLKDGVRCTRWNALDVALRDAMSRCDLVEMGDRGRELVERKYTWPAVCGKMIAGYEEVLNGRT